jgi:hypothetical protein
MLEPPTAAAQTSSQQPAVPVTCPSRPALHLCVHEMSLKGVTVHLVNIYVAILERRLQDNPVTVFFQNSAAIWEQRAHPIPILFPSFSPAHDEQELFAYTTSSSSPFRKWIRRKRKVVRFAGDNCVDSHHSLPNFIYSCLMSGAGTTIDQRRCCVDVWVWLRTECKLNNLVRAVQGVCVSGLICASCLRLHNAPLVHSRRACARVALAPSVLATPPLL